MKDFNSCNTESLNTTTLGAPLVSLLHHKSEPENVQGIGVRNIIEQLSPCSLQEELDLVSPEAPPHTIFRVHRVLRNTNNEAYEPRYISIGPYHSHNESLKKMNIHKLRYLKSLLGRQCISMQECVSAIERREPEARRCYAEPINLGPTEFCEMLVLDACFIIEFVKRYNARWREDDPIFAMRWLVFSTALDLILFENQVPLFVICELSNLIFGPQHEGELLKSLLKLFQDFYPVQVYETEHVDPTGVKHLLELIYKSFKITYEDHHVKDQTSMDGKANPGEIFIRSAVRLVESNVSFARTEADDSMFRIDFKDGCLRLPHLGIHDATECFWRNLIAYEQYFLDEEGNYFTDLATFLDRLINTAEDAKLLMKCGIIGNCLGSEEAVADMFNKLTDNVILSPGDYFIYKRQFKEVREHCSLRRNVWMAKLKRNHLNSPWAIISIFAAIVLILLTLLQTVFTIIN